MKHSTIGVVGYGYWSPNLIRNIQKIPEYTLAAICEKNLERHALIKEAHPDVPVLQHYRDLFKDETVDAVVIATIPSSHYRIARAALEAGKHVLVEKPLTLAVAEAEILRGIAKKHDRVLMVDHTFLYVPEVQKLRDIIRSGELGAMYSVDSVRVNLGLFQRDTNVLWDLAPHDISIFLTLFPERPSHVSAIASKTVVHPQQRGSAESIAHIVLHYPSGFKAHIHVSWVSPVKVRQLTVIGSERMARYDQLAEESLVVFEQGVYPNEDEGESGNLFTYKLGDTKSVSVSKGSEPLEAVLADFKSAVTEGTQPISNVDLAVEVVRILCAAEQSMRREGEKTPISYGGVRFLQKLLGDIHLK